MVGIFAVGPVHGGGLRIEFPGFPVRIAGDVEIAELQIPDGYGFLTQLGTVIGFQSEGNALCRDGELLKGDPFGGFPVPPFKMNGTF